MITLKSDKYFLGELGKSLNNVEINFEKSGFVFTAGDSINGSLEFPLWSAISDGIRNIYSLEIQLVGKVVVIKNPSVARLYQEKSPTSFWMGVNYEKLGEVYHVPFLTVHSQSHVNLTTNDIKIPFSLKIPENLPSSIFGRHGFISYRLVFLVKSHPQAVVKKHILTREPLIIGLARMKTELESAENFNFKAYKCTVKGNIVEMSARLVISEENDFVPGETVDFQVIVKNGLQLPLAGLTVVIHAVTSYTNLRSVTRQSGQEIRIGKCVFQKEGPHVPPGPGRTTKWNGTIKIPHVIPTGLGLEGCDTIDVQYFIHFELKKFVNLKLSLPIRIGNSKEISGNESTYESDMLGDSCSSHLGSTFSLLSLSSNASARSSGANSSRLWISDCSSLNSDPSPSGSRTLSSVRGGSVSSSDPPSYKSEWKVDADEILNASFQSLPPSYSAVKKKGQF